MAAKLRLEWSPEQIAGWLKRCHPHDAGMQLSRESIYRSLFVQTRGVLHKTLLTHLRTNCRMRRPKRARPTGQPGGRIRDAISIRSRPASIELRTVAGHWEGDLVSGSGNTHIATLVERKSRFTMLVKVKGKDTVNVVAALKKATTTAATPFA